MSKWEKGTHRITVVGQNFGPLAIRQVLGYDEEVWNVTHRDSGFFAGKFGTEASAKKYVELVAGSPLWGEVKIHNDGLNPSDVQMPDGLAQLATQARHVVEAGESVGRVRQVR